jgi:hypothetical protein
VWLELAHEAIKILFCWTVDHVPSGTQKQANSKFCQNKSVLQYFSNQNHSNEFRQGM